jgi:Rrf2 family protein
MLTPSKKGQYALRAVYELARRRQEGPLKTAQIAEAQAIPRRFLEVILNQLKGSGLVASKRGFYGGYYLLKTPQQITIGDVLRFLQKDQEPSRCLACVSQSVCPFNDKCAFATLWNKVKAAAYTIYDETTLQDLLNKNEPAEITAHVPAG